MKTVDLELLHRRLQLNDPVDVNAPELPGTWRMGGTYGYSWFVDPSEELRFTNMALERMSGRFTTDLCEAVYKGIRGVM